MVNVRSGGHPVSSGGASSQSRSGGGPLSEVVKDPAIRSLLESYSVPQTTLTPNPEEDIQQSIEGLTNQLPPLGIPDWGVPPSSRDELYGGEVPFVGPYNDEEDAYDLDLVGKRRLQSGEVPFASPVNPSGKNIQTRETLDAIQNNPEFPAEFNMEIEALDAQNEPIPDVTQRPNWTLQAASEQGKLAAIRNAMEAYTSPDPARRQEGALHLAELLQTGEGQVLESDQSSPWAKKNVPLMKDREIFDNAGELKKHLVRTAASIQPSIDAIGDYAREALFDFNEATMKVTDTSDPVMAIDYPVGVQTLIDKARREGLPDTSYLGQDTQESRMIQFVMGNAMMNAVAQSVGAAGKTKPDEGENADFDFDDDTSYVGDFINSIRAGAVNGFKNAGMDPNEYDLGGMSTALAYHLVNTGQISSMIDPIQHRPVLIPTSALRGVALSTARMTDIITGASTRGRTAIVPLAHGRALLERGTGLVKKAILKGLPSGIVRRAAEAVKTILGSVGMTFTQKLMSRKKRELDLIMHRDYLVVDPLDGQTPIYSNHPLASRLKLHKGAYDTAKLQVMYPPGYNPKDPAQVANFDQLKADRARDVMSMKFNEVKMYMQAANESASSNKVRFNRFIHALNNQRFYVSTFDGDYMGSKTIIREVMTFAKRDAAIGSDLFDDKKIEALKRVAAELYAGDSRSEDWGRKVQARMENLPNAQLGALGAMLNAVIYHTSAIEEHTIGGIPAEVSQGDPLSIINLYTKEMGQKLADLGGKLESYMLNGDPMADTQVPADEEMMKLWTAVEPGSSQGVLSLWDDFLQLQRASQQGAGAAPVRLSHHTIADGRQSGILLQALMYGISDPLNMKILGALASPNMLAADLRLQVFNGMIDKLQTKLGEEQADKLSGFLNFFKSLSDAQGMEAVAKNWIKKPLMQAAYGKNVMMFFSELMETLQNDDAAVKLWEEHVAPQYGGDMKAAMKELTSVVGDSLREVIDSQSNKVLENYGQWLGVLNQAALIEGPTNDTIVLVPTTNVAVNAKTGMTSKTTREEKSSLTGKILTTKTNNYEKIQAETAEGRKSITLTEPQNFPAAPRRKIFRDPQTESRVVVTEPHGYAMRRQLAILMVQSLDGDAIKWTTLLANEKKSKRDKSGPRPIYWIHDSSVSTPGQSLIYNHIYNNRTLPQLAKHMVKLGEKLTKAETRARQQVWDHLRRIELVDGLVGIGIEGEYPALGAIFEEWERKMVTDDGTYADRWNDKNKFLKRKERVVELLKEARQNGWRSEVDFKDVKTDQVDPQWKRWQRELAVTPDQAKVLFRLAKTLLGMMKGEPDDNWTPWVEAHGKRTANTVKAFQRLSQRGGKAHLTPQKGRGIGSAPKEGTATNTLAAVQQEASQEATERRLGMQDADALDDRPFMDHHRDLPEGITDQRAKEARQSIRRKVAEAEVERRLVAFLFSQLGAEAKVSRADLAEARETLNKRNGKAATVMELYEWLKTNKKIKGIEMKPEIPLDLDELEQRMDLDSDEIPF